MNLLTATTFSADGIILAVYYGVCVLLIIVGIIVTAALKRKTKKELNATTVKKYCLKAKKVADEMLDDSASENFLLGATKLGNLSKSVANASWYAFQIYELKRDLIFEGIASNLDRLATELANDSEIGYVPFETYKEDVEKAVESLTAIIEKLESLQ